MKRGLSFAVRCLLIYETYYLVANQLRKYQETNTTDLTPQFDNLTSVVVATNQGADELEARGFEFCSHIWNAREMLSNGAIAVCTFVGPELATISWAAITEKAKRSLIFLPIKVKLDKGEAFSAGALTIPKYWGMELMSYNSVQRDEFLANKKVVRSIGIINKKNIISQKGAATAGMKPYAGARYLKILRWEFWKETPLRQSEALRKLISKTPR